MDLVAKISIEFIFKCNEKTQHQVDNLKLELAELLNKMKEYDLINQVEIDKIKHNAKQSYYLDMKVDEYGDFRYTLNNVPDVIRKFK